MTLTRVGLLIGGLVGLTACPDGTPKCDSGDSACETGGDSTVDTSDTNTECGEYTGASYVGFDSSACSQPVTTDPAVYFGCEDGTTGDWWYGAWTVGWTDGGQVEITQTGAQNGWDELHPITDSFEFDADGWWDAPYLELSGTDNANDQTDGVSTLYNCDQARIDSLTFEMTIDFADGSSECGVWGDDQSISSCDDWSGYF